MWVVWGPVLVANNLHYRGSNCPATPMPGVSLEKRSPLKELILLNTIASPSKDKGKSREQVEMEEGKVEKAQSPSLTVSKYEGVFQNRDSTFIYNWIDNKMGDSWSDLDIKETEWLTDQSYQDTNKEEPTE
jgi:hypothetical protein